MSVPDSLNEKSLLAVRVWVSFNLQKYQKNRRLAFVECPQYVLIDNRFKVSSDLGVYETSAYDPEATKRR